jgi:hypothetical protein
LNPVDCLSERNLPGFRDLLYRRGLHSCSVANAIRSVAGISALVMIVSNSVGAPPHPTKPKASAVQSASPAQSPSEASQIVLEVEAAGSGNSLVFSRPDDGIITLNIFYHGRMPIQAEVKTTAFASERGSVKVDILDECGKSVSKRSQPVTLSIQPDAITPLCLFVEALPTAAKYTGRLIITAPGAEPWIKEVTVAQPVTLGTPNGPTPFVLDLQAPGSGEPAVLTRPEDGIVNLNIFYSGKSPIKAEIQTTAFSSDSGSIEADILGDASKPDSKEQQPVTRMVQPNTIVPLTLLVQPLPTTAKYSGRLIISAPGVAPLITAVSIAQPVFPEGTLVLDQTTASQTLEKGKPATFSVVLSEKTGKIPLRGLSVRLEQVSNSPDKGFDLEKNIKFELNGQPVTDFGRYTPATDDTDNRTIPVAGKSVVTVTLNDLQPGDYAVTLRFTASNSASDDAQKFQVNVHVRDPVGWAVVCLLAALILSFAATKVLTDLRRRAKLLQQIHNLQPRWLSSLLPSPAVVWVRAVLHQARRLSRDFWLTSPELIEANVNNVRSVLGVLDRVEQLRQALEVGLEQLVFKRAVLALDNVVARLGTSPLTDSTLQSINADLDAIKDWLNKDKFTETFWEDIRPSLESLRSEVAEAVFPDVADASSFMGKLRDDLRAALDVPPDKRAKPEEAYRDYAKLRILWDQRADPIDDPDRISVREFETLIGAAQADMDQFFKLADNLLWKRIQRKNLTLRVPNADQADDLEAYQMLQFSVDTVDAAIKHSYLFSHKIEYKWCFKREKDWWRSCSEWFWTGRWPGVLPPLQPRSLVPSVVQYFPEPCKVSVSVTLVYENETGAKVTADEKLPIVKSSDFEGFQILKGTGFASWAIAAIVAIATGLSMFYYKGTSWGTYQDYLTLFLWGVGVDQGKNFLQALQAYSGQSAIPSSDSHS